MGVSLECVPSSEVYCTAIFGTDNIMAVYNVGMQ